MQKAAFRMKRQPSENSFGFVSCTLKKNDIFCQLIRDAWYRGDIDLCEGYDAMSSHFYNWLVIFHALFH